MVESLQGVPPSIKSDPTLRSANKVTDKKKVAHDFESLFMGQVVGELMRTINFGQGSGGFGADMWRSFLANAVAEKIVDRTDLGMVKNIERMLDAYRK